MTGHIIDTPEKRDRIAEQIKLLPVEKQPYEIVIEPYKDNRTDAQNRLMWFWLRHLSQETGHTKEELHEYAKEQILGPPVNKKVLDRVVTIPNSTADKNIKEFIDYLEEFEHLFAAKGRTLPAPHYYEQAMRRE